MPVVFQNGKLLFVGGKLAMSAACCCDCIGGGRTVVATVTPGTATSSNWGSRMSTGQNVADSAARAHNWEESASFTPAGGGARVEIPEFEISTGATYASQALPSGVCPDENLTPLLSVSYDSSGPSVEYRIVTVLRGTLVLSFLPRVSFEFSYVLDGNGEPTNVLDTGKNAKVVYHPSLSVTEQTDGGAATTTTHAMTFDTTAATYSGAYTKTISIQ